jgi:hypothetical protein
MFLQLTWLLNDRPAKLYFTTTVSPQKTHAYQHKQTTSTSRLQDRNKGRPWTSATAECLKGLLTPTGEYAKQQDSPRLKGLPALPRHES